MDYVEDCGYDNLSLSRVMARVFSLKRTPLNMWVIYSMGRDKVFQI